MEPLARKRKGRKIKNGTGNNSSKGFGHEEKDVSLK